jgi:hypothetical protein
MGSGYLEQPPVGWTCKLETQQYILQVPLRKQKLDSELLYDLDA